MGQTFTHTKYMDPDQLFNNENYLKALECEQAILNKSGLRVFKDINLKNYKITNEIIVHGYDTKVNKSQQKSQAAPEQSSQNHQNETNQIQNLETNTYNSNNNYDTLENSLKNINYNYENKNSTNKEKNNDKNKKKILFIHGYMSSGASFYKMLYKLNHDFEIYSIDLPGMGLSSRPKFNYVNFQDNLDFFIKTIEKYTEMAELDKFILVGHSFGGYISTRYAIQNPEKVEKLYLISPLGVTHRDLEDIKKIEEEQFQQKNMKTNIMKYIRDSFNQGGTLQNMSSKPHIPTQFILERWMKYWFPHEHETEDRILFQTFLHNILKLPTSSDIALNNMFYFTKLQAKEPLEKLLVDFPVDTHFYYGDRDWMCHQGAKRVHMEKARKYFNIVKNAGHNIQLDQPQFLIEEITHQSS